MTTPTTVEQMLAVARAAVTEVDPQQVSGMQRDGWLVLDVREADELSQGMIRGARHCSRGRLEMQLPQWLHDREQPLLLVCAQGLRSVLAAQTLQQLGYPQVCSLRGGMHAWQRAGLPQQLPATADNAGLSSAQQQRYARHLQLPQIAAAGQQRLLDSSVLVIGAGGLGSPAALYLAAAGVGRIGIVDDDRIELSNLQRQILHSTSMCGEMKTESARARLKQLNPEVQVDTHAVRLDEANVSTIITDAYDVVVDGSDNYATRYLVNRACVALDKPMVYAAVEGFVAQLAVFWPSAQADAPCYQCLFPQAGDRPSCSEAGVLGAVPGVAGVMQAIEAIKLCLRLPSVLTGKLLQINTLDTTFTLSGMRADANCEVCAGQRHSAARTHAARPRAERLR
ncbi:MAG: molybdopterin-synthase adenylyltransferase MoeB [Wenzhouxiangellaceae bacterium]